MKQETRRTDATDDMGLFGLALGLSEPWRVERVEFVGEPGELHLHLEAGGVERMSCAPCGALCPVYDRSEERVWRHLNFFQFKAFLHARQPRVRCGACGIKTVNVPWARPGSGFTLLFEAFTLLLGRLMPVASLAQLMSENDTRLWRVLEHYVEQARAEVDMSEVKQIGIDETSRRGHEYVTVVADQTAGQAKRVLFVTEGKDAATVECFKADLETHGGKTEQISAVSMDMSPAFQSGVTQSFPQAMMIFDRFHVVKLLNEAVDQVRRNEVQGNPLLKHSRSLWLSNPENLSERQRDKLAPLNEMNLATATAYQMKLNFQELWKLKDRKEAATFLEKWCRWVLDKDGPTPMKKVACAIQNHSEGILNYFTATLTNGLLEGINSLIQAAKAKARGYRSTKYLKIIIYLVAGKLDFRLPSFHSR